MNICRSSVEEIRVVRKPLPLPICISYAVRYYLKIVSFLFIFSKTTHTIQSIGYTYANGTAMQMKPPGRLLRPGPVLPPLQCCCRELRPFQCYSGCCPYTPPLSRPVQHS